MNPQQQRTRGAARQLRQFAAATDSKRAETFAAVAAHYAELAADIERGDPPEVDG